jgi:hypothetical protein
MALQAGATVDDVSASLDHVSTGSEDNFVVPSPDGVYLVVQSGRFGCGSGSCLSVFYWDGSAGVSVLVNGNAVSTGEARAVIASGGKTIVFPRGGGPHTLDLYATTYASGKWSDPAILTGQSSFAYHHDTTMSYDGTKVAFDCSDSLYESNTGQICEVGVNGGGFHVVLGPNDGPDTQTYGWHHPGYAPDGSLVVESSYPGEQIYRSTNGGKAQALSSDSNDNSPCAAGDGRIVSLWLNAPGDNAGDHWIKFMNSNGSNDQIILQQDVVDIGNACGP